MTPADLREQISIDAEASEQTLQHLRDLRSRFVGRHPDVHDLAALGAYVRDVYQGFENMLLRIIKFHGVPRPDGGDWHLSVFKLFSDPPIPPLPLLITADLADRIGNIVVSGMFSTNGTLHTLIGKSSNRSSRTWN